MLLNDATGHHVTSILWLPFLISRLEVMLSELFVRAVSANHNLDRYTVVDTVFHLYLGTGLVREFTKYHAYGQTLLETSSVLSMVALCDLSLILAHHPPGREPGGSSIPLPGCVLGPLVALDPARKRSKAQCLQNVPRHSLQICGLITKAVFSPSIWMLPVYNRSYLKVVPMPGNVLAE